ncbi:hypothetical protein AB0H77_21845 [Streptomyces sp. NPDC050844]|uniref:hypothetical protein n=1 Tax=Streptomyces sp. NPDC050844 TaxID=3155790 RepID=UPI0033C14631
MRAPTSIEWLRAAAGRICVGSQRLAVHLGRRLATRVKALYERIRDWLNSSTGLSWWVKVVLLVLAFLLLRKVVTSVAGGVYRRIESGAWSWMLWPAVLLWLIAAYRAGRPGWKPKAPAAAVAEEPEPEEERPADVGSETSEEPSSAPRTEPRVPTFRELCAALAAVGTPHAHLAVLASQLGTSPDLVREGLDRCGVTVQAVRMRGRGSSTGVKGDALPPPRAARGSVVAAGQPANNDNNNTPDETPREGLRVKAIGQGGRLVYDPADTVRHHKTGQ